LCEGTTSRAFLGDKSVRQLFLRRRLTNLALSEFSSPWQESKAATVLQPRDRKLLELYFEPLNQFPLLRFALGFGFLEI
jgi:hypothetical protein